MYYIYHKNIHALSKCLSFPLFYLYFKKSLGNWVCKNNCGPQPPRCPCVVTSNKANVCSQQDTMEMKKCDFQSQVIKYIAASALLALGSLTLVEANHHVVKKLKQPTEDHHGVRSWGLLPPATINSPVMWLSCLEARPTADILTITSRL